ASLTSSRQTSARARATVGCVVTVWSALGLRLPPGAAAATVLAGGRRPGGAHGEPRRPGPRRPTTTNAAGRPVLDGPHLVGGGPAPRDPDGAADARPAGRATSAAPIPPPQATPNEPPRSNQCQPYRCERSASCKPTSSSFSHTPRQRPCEALP